MKSKKIRNNYKVVRNNFLIQLENPRKLCYNTRGALRMESLSMPRGVII